MLERPKSKRIFYFDAIRAIAILCVIIVNITAFMPQIINYTPNMFYSLDGFWEMFSNNTFRIGVSLFLMLSGALTLGREWEIDKFLRKRFLRIVFPFVFWTIICSIILIVLTYFFPQIGFTNDFSIWGILSIIHQAFIYKAPGFSGYWYIWMIMGLCLIMPILNKWLLNADLREAEYFLILWIGNTIFEHTLMINSPVKLSYFVSPVGLVVLGYYLRHTERKIFNHKIMAWLMILIPVTFMLMHSYDVLDTKMIFIFNKYSLPLIVEAIGVFCLFKCSDYLKNPNPHLKKFLTTVALCSYGMYLTNYMFIITLGNILPIQVLGYFGMYIILFVASFFGSLILINRL